MPSIRGPLLPGAACVAAFLLLLLAACAADQAASGGQPPIHRVEAGDAARGLVSTEENCASCHAIAAAADRSPDIEAPPFESIANTPGMTGIALSAWMQSAHHNMPHLMVDQDRVDDLWAYMSTLKEAD